MNHNTSMTPFRVIYFVITLLLGHNLRKILKNSPFGNHTHFKQVYFPLRQTVRAVLATRSLLSDILMWRGMVNCLEIYILIQSSR